MTVLTILTYFDTGYSGLVWSVSKMKAGALWGSGLIDGGAKKRVGTKIQVCSLPSRIGLARYEGMTPNGGHTFTN